MTATLTDPRTELVRQAADDVEHIFCDACWKPGMSMLCGVPDPDPDRPPHDGETCGCATCPACEWEWERHERERHDHSHEPWWKRWLP